MSFDVDRIVGEGSEVKLASYLKPYFTVTPYLDGKQKEADLVVNNLLVEVKRDLRGDTTGNFGIEFICRGKKSGISTTKSDVWVIATATHFYCFKTENLKTFLRSNWKYLKKVQGGDDNLSHMVLVKQSDLKPLCYCVIQGGCGARNFC